LTIRLGCLKVMVQGGFILRTVILFGVVVATLSMGACAKPVGQMYPTPLEGTPTANITIAKSPNLSLGGDSVGFYAFDNEVCEDTDGSGGLGGLMWTTPNSMSTQVAADRRLVVRALTARVLGTGGGSSITNCTNLIALTPEQGRTYTLRHMLFPAQETCVVDVIDGETGKAPSSLERLPLVESCQTLALRARKD
jgi:hypothetical protein